MKKKKRIRRGKIFVSPDGGETVYEQKLDGSRGMLVSKSQLAKDIETKEQKIINNEYGGVFMKSQFYGDGIRSLTLFPNHSSKSLTTNSLGFRGQNFQDKVKKRIVFMGGSAAFGWQSSSNETAPAKNLEKKMKKNGFDYDVIRLAIPSGNFAMDLNMIVPYLLQLNPDIVVFFNWYK